MKRSGGSLVDGDMPHGIAGVLECAEAEEEKVRRRASAAIKEIEAERDAELRALASVIGGLRGEEMSTDRPAGRPRAPRRTRRRGRSSPAEAAIERADQVLRYLAEEGRKVKFAEVKGALRLTDSMTAGALKRLVAGERVEREGRGSSTRYFLSPAQRAAIDGSAGPTRAGRILELVAERGSASPGELAQALRMSVEQIERECGPLVAEDHLRMSQRDGIRVYVPLGSLR